MGVKKGIYKMPGSQKQYCKCNGTMMDIASFRKLKKSKLTGKKPKKTVKSVRGGEYESGDDDLDYSGGELEGDDYGVQPITGGRKNSKKGGEAESDSDYESEMNYMDKDSFPVVGGKKKSKKGGEIPEIPPIVLGGKKMSKKGGEADDNQFLGGKKMSKKGGEADDNQIMGGKKNSKKGGEADDNQIMGGKKMSKKGGVADFHTPRLGFDDIPLFTDSLSNTFKQIIGGKKSKKGGNVDYRSMMGGKKVSRGGGNDIVMEGGNKNSLEEGDEYDVL